MISVLHKPTKTIIQVEENIVKVLTNELYFIAEWRKMMMSSGGIFEKEGPIMPAPYSFLNLISDDPKFDIVRFEEVQNKDYVIADNINYKVLFGQ